MSFALIALVVLVALFLFPVKVMCGAPGKSCASAPDENGKVSRYYVYEPLGIWMIESVLDRDIQIHYIKRTEKS